MTRRLEAVGHARPQPRRRRVAPPQDEAARAHAEVAARRRAAFVTPIHLSNSQSSSFLRRNFCARAFASLLRQAPIEGWRSAERRAGATAPVGACRIAAHQAPSEAPCVP